ncbi:MAG: tetratricopeptide repeat protein, partial [Crocinitomicaceae bacterium]
MKLIPLVVLLFFCSVPAFAQTLEEKQQKADELFESQQYEAAAKIYSEVLSQKPRDYEVNFRYGTCLIFTSHDKQEAIKYLAYSVKSPSIDKRAYYFLGRAYHLNYQFKEAEKYYQKFKEQASTKQLKEYNVDAQLNGTRYGRKLLANVTDMIVMEKKEIREASFYDLYDLSGIGGTILVTDEFGTKYDKKVEHRSVIHFPKDSPNIFYSSYGDDGATGLDIYQMKKLPNGKYSLSQKVRGQVNTNDDEDYAYMDPNGEFLYFSSKGHNSMGGYDVFRSKYDPKIDSFGPPENMDFAISSPDDDILYVVDSKGSRAFFASKRESQQGKVFVYEVRVERIPMQIAAIKGDFINSIVSSNKDITIQVEDFNSGREVGTFISKSASGEYFMTFPKGGKYKFFISVKGSDVTHYAVVEIPTLRELRPLKQRITLLRDESGEQVIKIENLFDEEFDDPVTVMAQIYRELALLKPNAEEFDLDSLTEMKDMDKIFVENGLDAFSTHDDVVYVLEEEVEDLKKEQEENQELSNITYNLAAEKSKEANEKMVEVNQLIQKAEKSTDPAEKQALFKEADALNNEVEKLNREAKSFVELGQKVDEDLASKTEILKNAEEVLTTVKQSPEEDRAALATIVKENSDFFKETIKDRDVQPKVTEQIIKDANNEVKALNEVNSQIIELNNRKNDLNKQLDILEDQLENTKKKKDREVLEDKILDTRSDLNVVEEQLRQKTIAYDVLLKERKTNLSKFAEEIGDEKYKNSIYSEELTDVEKVEIAKKVRENDVSENVAIVDEKLKENGIGDRVSLFASSEQRSTYSLEQWTGEIDKEIKNLRDELNTASPERKEQILQQIDEFENLKEKKRQEFDVVEDGGTNGMQSDPSKALNLVDDDYQRNVNKIYEIVDENERENQLKTLNDNILSSTNEKIQEYDAILDTDPDNEDAKKKRGELIALKDKIEKNPYEPIVDPVTIDPDQINTKVDESDFVDNYSDRKDKIEKIEDEFDRKIEQNKLNREMSNRIRSEIKQLNNILKDDPENKNAQKRLKKLMDLDDELNRSIVENKDWLVDNPKTVDETNLADVSTVNSDYQEQVNSIATITNNEDKTNAIRELNEETVTAINKRINEIDKALLDQPDNEELKKEKEQLINLKNSIQNNPEKAVLSPIEIAEIIENPSANDLLTDYDQKMNDITTSDVDQKSKEEQKIIVNQSVIQEIDNEIKRLEELKTENPERSEEADKSIRKLNELKTAKQREIESSENRIAELSSTADNGTTDNNTTDNTATNQELLDMNEVADIAELFPDYESKLSDIENSSASETEKERQKITLNKELINKIDAEIDRMD